VPQHIGHAMLSDINISHGSVATLLKCGGICNDVYCKFPGECSSERILKIGHYLAKLWYGQEFGVLLQGVSGSC